MENIIEETLRSLRRYLPKIIKGCSEIIDNLQTGNEATALNLMPHFVEGLQWIFEAITGLQNNGYLHEIKLISLKEHFVEVVEALEIGDYVLLADLLDYEIAPTLERWESIISKDLI